MGMMLKCLALVLVLFVKNSFSMEYVGRELATCTYNKRFTHINCIRKNLTEIPSIPQSAEKLHLDFNSLTKVKSYAFMGLVNLQAVYLKNNKIEIIEPLAFDGLVLLEILDIGHNKLSCISNSSLAGMPKLKRLYVTRNKLQFVFPDAFQGTSSLIYINVGANDLTSVPDFGNQPRLKQIDLYDNELNSALFPVSYKDGPQDVTIILTGNKITYVKETDFSSFDNRRILELYLSQNLITEIDASTFDNCSIQKLKIDHNPLSAVALRNLSKGLSGKSLHILDLSYVPLSTFEWEQELSFFKNTSVKILRLNGNRIVTIRFALLASLTDLKELELSKNKVVNSESTAFVKMTNLTTLILDENNIDIIPERLPVSLKILHLNSNKIKTIQTNAFKPLRRLKHLQIKGNNIVHLQRDAFSGLENLEMLELRDNRIGYLPGSLFNHFRHLASLDLSKNNLQRINPVAGRFRLLTSLRFLSIADNQCSFLPSDTFASMTSLQVLHMERNNLSYIVAEEVGSRIFCRLKQLQELYISRNNIESFDKAIFHDTWSLKKLYADHNKISTWNPLVFRMNKNLSVLDLSYNLLSVLNREQFVHLDSLQVLNLQGNPFICNCELLWFRKWLQTTPILLPSNSSFTCHGPKDWDGKLLLDFHESKIDCALFSKYTVIGASLGGLLAAGICSALVYRFRWRIRLGLYLISKRGRRCFSFTNAEDERQNYGFIEDHPELFDAYISCSDYEEDKHWVLQHLLPGIDNGQLDDGTPSGGDFRLFFEDRDSQPGLNIVGNIFENLRKSKKFIAVLTRQYYCRKNEFELDQATALFHEDELKDIVVIKVGDIPAGRVPPHLYAKMRNGSFIEWEDDENAIESFREKLKDRLREHHRQRYKHLLTREAARSGIK